MMVGGCVFGEWPKSWVRSVCLKLSVKTDIFPAVAGRLYWKLLSRSPDGRAGIRSNFHCSCCGPECCIVEEQYSRDVERRKKLSLIPRASGRSKKEERLYIISGSRKRRLNLSVPTFFKGGESWMNDPISLSLSPNHRRLSYCTQSPPKGEGCSSQYSEGILQIWLMAARYLHCVRVIFLGTVTGIKRKR